MPAPIMYEKAKKHIAEQTGQIGSNRTEHVYILSERGYMQFIINGNNPDQLIGFIVFALVFVVILVALLFLEFKALSSKSEGEFAKRMLVFGAVNCN